MPSFTYCESTCISTVQGRFRLSSATMAASQFHAVVGGFRLAAGQFLARAVVVEDGAPAAGAGIARTGAIGVNDDLVFASCGRLACAQFARQFERHIFLAQHHVLDRHIIMRAEGINDFIDQNFRRRSACRKADACASLQSCAQSKSAARCTSMARAAAVLDRPLQPGAWNWTNWAHRPQAADQSVRRWTSPPPGGWWWHSRYLRA